MYKELIVCDLDNTLYDWVGYFVPSFYAMVDEVVRITGCDRELLLDDFRKVHRRHHDSEHPFSLLETETIRNLYPDKDLADIARILDPAFYAFNSSRKQNLKLYDGVKESLDFLSNSGVTLVAHTESKLYNVLDRLNRLELNEYFCRIYCRERPQSLHPDPITNRNWLNQFSLKNVVELSHHQRKPNPDVLLEICQNEGFTPHDSAYVGDSIARDILMAKTANVYAIWAKYGSTHSEEQYAALVRISHWTPEDVEREQRLKKQAEGIKPDYVLENSFEEILDALGYNLSIAGQVSE